MKCRPGVWMGQRSDRFVASWLGFSWSRIASSAVGRCPALCGWDRSCSWSSRPWPQFCPRCTRSFLHTWLSCRMPSSCLRCASLAALFVATLSFDSPLAASSSSRLASLSPGIAVPTFRGYILSSVQSFLVSLHAFGSFWGPSYGNPATWAYLWKIHRCFHQGNDWPWPWCEVFDPGIWGTLGARRRTVWKSGTSAVSYQLRQDGKSAGSVACPRLFSFCSAWAKCAETARSSSPGMPSVSPRIQAAARSFRLLGTSIFEVPCNDDSPSAILCRPCPINWPVMACTPSFCS